METYRGIVYPSQLDHVMRHAETGTEVADTELVGVHFDRVARKSLPFPEAIYQAGQSASSSGG
ncbi:MAG: hypothetical protein JRJ80_19635 [Deltaproteobacteria bacterium]|nr:hypothetical protein [Deltaproteobacteria bacterium]MBW2190395.1 hypothetical protein [Deltaproteobacteria bacterium]MBW2381579.1 hypothetical protein [Deltaproteobacteria bacterium]